MYVVMIEVTGPVHLHKGLAHVLSKEVKKLFNAKLVAIACPIISDPLFMIQRTLHYDFFTPV